MADERQLAVARQGSDAWNAWREQNLGVDVDLTEAELSGVDLSGADLSRADLFGAHLSNANLSGADLAKSDLAGAYLSMTDLSGAHLANANLAEANLSGADLAAAHGLVAVFFKADLAAANLTGANLNSTSFSSANLTGAHLTRAYLIGAKLHLADLSGANLTEANLEEADLHWANLSGANLTGADLSWARLVESDFKGAALKSCRVYGISAWDLRLDDAVQEDLIITRDDQPKITVDNLEVAQFIYLLLHNEKIRAVIDTVGKKGVLLLGRFMDGRIAILERLQDELRRRGWVPMVFNFDKPDTKDFTETVRLLAGLSRFVIADITNPRSTPLELQATVPECMVPFVPILEKGEDPFSMFQDLWVKHRDWVLEPIRYSSVMPWCVGSMRQSSRQPSPSPPS